MCGHVTATVALTPPSVRPSWGHTCCGAKRTSVKRPEWKPKCSRLARLLLRTERAALLGLSVPTGISAPLASLAPGLGHKAEQQGTDGGSSRRGKPAFLPPCSRSPARAARSTAGAWCAQQDGQGEEHPLHRSGIRGPRLL